MVIGAVIAFILPPSGDGVAQAGGDVEQSLLEDVEGATDHMEPEQLAAALMKEDGNLLLIDVRPADEYAVFHIPTAVNVSLPDLPRYLDHANHSGPVVLYSNGMTHPAQARDALVRLGYQNVYMLTDGLQGFLDRCLKPVSLRSQPLTSDQAAQVRAWRSYFLGVAAATPVVASTQPAADQAAVAFTEVDAPRLTATSWLEQHLNDDDLRIIDCRQHADYTQGHIPGAVYLHFESVRGDVAGLPSVLLPKEILAAHMSVMGIKPTDMVVLDPGDSVRDATLISMALQRLGHQRWAILHGGFPKWSAENRPTEQTFPKIAKSDYPVPDTADNVTADAAYIAERLEDGKTVIIDTRPHEYFTGEKSREMRPGRIPGAVNHVYSEDLDDAGNLKDVTQLATAYQQLLPNKEAPVVVYCRTGHQASLTFFVLKEMLGYPNVKWYDGSWSDWATRDLPAEKG